MCCVTLVLSCIVFHCSCARLLFLYCACSLFLYCACSLFLYCAYSLFLYCACSLFLYCAYSLFLYCACSLFLYCATLTEVFRAFSSVVRQMPGYNWQRQGTAGISQILLSLYFVYCLCV